MKLFVFFLFSALPWLPWVGDWALRWTRGNEQLEVAFAMFIFPLGMNAIQYWVIDNFIMEKKPAGGKGGEGYEQVDQGDEDEDGLDGSVTEVGEAGLGKDSEDGSPSLAEANPTPIPDYDGATLRTQAGSGSRAPTPKVVDDEDGKR